MKYILQAKSRNLKGSIFLPASKSLSNRALIIQALCNEAIDIFNLSDADDTLTLERVLAENQPISDIGPAGTAMRFLTAYYASRPGYRILTGTLRMKQRPIGPLVDALRSLGASIQYLENEGFPPLKIEGRKLQGGTVSLRGDISSQFITALMLIAPTLSQGLIISLEGNVLSRPYILMTAKLMEQCGAVVKVDKTTISIEPTGYRPTQIHIETDWSAAAFWLEAGALARKASFVLPGLAPNSLQGDAEVTEIFGELGLQFHFSKTGLEVTKQEDWQPEGIFTRNLSNHPDLVQPTAISCVALGQEAVLTGLDNLRLKETDRLKALQLEVWKLGGSLQVEEHTIRIKPTPLHAPEIPLEAHDDHRMAMGLAPLAFRFREITIANPMVVKKSYPTFWNECSKFFNVRGRN